MIKSLAVALLVIAAFFILVYISFEIDSGKTFNNTMSYSNDFGSPRCNKLKETTKRKNFSAIDHAILPATAIAPAETNDLIARDCYREKPKASTIAKPNIRMPKQTAINRPTSAPLRSELLSWWLWNERWRRCRWSLHRWKVAWRSLPTWKTVWWTEKIRRFRIEIKRIHD